MNSVPTNRNEYEVYKLHINMCAGTAANEIKQKYTATRYCDTMYAMDEEYHLKLNTKRT